MKKSKKTKPRRTQTSTAPTIQAAGRVRWETYKGETKRVSEWATLYGKKVKTVISRLERGKSIGEALEDELERNVIGTEGVAARRQALKEIITEQQPMNVRSVYYQAVVREIVEKTEKGLSRVESDVVWLREKGLVPYSHIVDYNRTSIKPYAFNSVGEALQECADSYRVNLWRDADVLVAIFLEKVGLAGTIENITLATGVPLHPVRGYSSHSYLWEIAQELREEERPVHAYMLGDHDPSGVDARRHIRELMVRPDFAPNVDFRWHELGLNETQIRRWKLPTRETKEEDTRSVNWTRGESAELDAVEPRRLRKMVKDAIDRHMSDAQRARLRANEEAEREYIQRLARAADGDDEEE
jgi:hypothetical protein